MRASIAPRAYALLVVSAVAGMVIAIWLTAQLAGWDEERVLEWIPGAGAVAAIVVVGLLVTDVVLPIPATIVMLGSGVLFGPIVGSTINGIGLLAAALAGYALGRAVPERMAPTRLAARRVEGAEPMRYVWIAVTRGMPVLGESYAIGAGVLSVPARPFALASALGAAVVGAVYGVAGWWFGDHWALVIVAGGLAAAAYLAYEWTSRSGEGRRDRRGRHRPANLHP